MWVCMCVFARDGERETEWSKHGHSVFIHAFGHWVLSAHSKLSHACFIIICAKKFLFTVNTMWIEDLWDSICALLYDKSAIIFLHVSSSFVLVLYAHFTEYAAAGSKNLQCHFIRDIPANWNRKRGTLNAWKKNSNQECCCVKRS